MANTDDIPFKCEFVVPKAGDDPQSVIPRWSSSRLQLPALVVTPNNDSDIVTAIQYAREKGLRVIPKGGGHGSFVPINSETLYLDMKNFNKVELDKAEGLVHIGGGAVVRDVIKATTDEGYYTTWPNSNAVGMVGCILGGGNNGMNGLHGFMIDNIVSFKVITAEGESLELKSSSTGEDKALFSALCGGGIGLTVVTAITLKAFPISSLNMDDDKIWTRSLIFPPTAIDLAAETFLKLQPPLPSMNTVLAFMRSPPGTPAPGAPMIALSAMSYGPSKDAEKAMSLLFEPDVTEKAIKSTTTFTPLPLSTAAFEVINAHGDYKDGSSSFLKTLNVDTITAGFRQWVGFTDKYPDAKRTLLVIAGFNIKKLTEYGESPEGQAKFCQIRDRSFFASTWGWCTTPETATAMWSFQSEFNKLCRQNDTAVPRTFANNITPETKVEELHSEDKIAELKRVKRVWDSKGLFWNLYA